jgi:hypothetical protein
MDYTSFLSVCSKKAIRLDLQHEQQPVHDRITSGKQTPAQECLTSPTDPPDDFPLAEMISLNIKIDVQSPSIKSSGKKRKASLMDRTEESRLAPHIISTYNGSHFSDADESSLLDSLQTLPFSPGPGIVFPGENLLCQDSQNFSAEHELFQSQYTESGTEIHGAAIDSVDNARIHHWPNFFGDPFERNQYRKRVAEDDLIDVVDDVDDMLKDVGHTKLNTVIELFDRAFRALVKEQLSSIAPSLWSPGYLPVGPPRRNTVLLDISLT